MLENQVWKRTGMKGGCIAITMYWITPNTIRWGFHIYHHWTRHTVIYTFTGLAATTLPGNHMLLPPQPIRKKPPLLCCFMSPVPLQIIAKCINWSGRLGRYVYVYIYTYMYTYMYIYNICGRRPTLPTSKSHKIGNFLVTDWME